MKVIDLLNKIANGEEVPQEIKLDNKYFCYDETDGAEIYRYRTTSGDFLTDYANLNDEVKIIEEDKKIEKKKEIECLHVCTESNEYLVKKINEIIDAINELNKYPFDKKLIHGDFGAHNFIKRNEKFVAAIDPQPIAGDPTYDLLFALVSNIDLIPFLSIDYLNQLCYYASRYKVCRRET